VQYSITHLKGIECSGGGLAPGTRSVSLPAVDAASSNISSKYSEHVKTRPVYNTFLVSGLVLRNKNEKHRNRDSFASAERVTFYRSGTGTVINYGSGYGSGTRT
jgi:hypothetical protein